jgi:hypothetical protein
MKPRSVSTRRAFFCSAGAALSGPLALAAATPRQQARAGSLEDENAIRAVQLAYASRLNERAYTEVLDLFAEDAQVLLSGVTFAGTTGIRRLYLGHFAQRGIAGPHPVHVLLIPYAPQLDIIRVAADRQSATGRFHYLVDAEAPLPAGPPLVEMARQQGGTMRWREHGACENSYVRVGEAWKITRLEYRATPADGLG